MQKINEFIYLSQTSKATFLVEGMNKAIAIQYKKGLTPVPCVIVKGENEEKEFMLKLAKESNIPVIRDLGLVSMLYHVDYYVPEETFAEIVVIMSDLIKKQKISI